MRGLLAIVLLIPQLSFAIEKPKYTVLDTIEEVEIRSYPELIVARTLVDASFKGAGNQGFRRLGGYIFGDNQQEQKIAMTAPVAQSQAEDGSYWVSFYMPAEYARDELPKPNNNAVEIQRRPAQTVAVIVYKGNWSEEKFRLHESQLRAVLTNHETWQMTGEAIWARYNPPIMPSFFRTNEAMIPVSKRNVPQGPS